MQRIFQKILFLSYLTTASAYADHDDDVLIFNGSTTVSAFCGLEHGHWDGLENRRIRIKKTNSGKGIIELINGSADVAMVASSLSVLLENLYQKKDVIMPSLDSFRAHVIASANVEFIVAKDSLVNELSEKQLEGVLSGRIRNWKELGFADEKITIVTEQPTGSMYGLVKKYVMDGEDFAPNHRMVRSAPQAALVVSRVSGSIGIVSSETKPENDSDFKSIKIKGMKPITQQLSFVTKADDVRAGLKKAIFSLGDYCKQNKQDTSSRGDGHMRATKLSSINKKVVNY